MSVPKRNLAARAGYWSAKHRKIAIGGWLAFVVIAFVLGGAIGTNTLSDDDSGNGQSRVADKAITKADFPEKADEQVLLQSRDGKLTVDDPKFQTAVAGVVNQLKSAKDVIDVKSPLSKGNEGQISKDGRSALVTFSIPGDEELDTKVVPSLDATAAAQRAHPDLRIEQFGDASADKALGASLDDDFKRAEFLSLPITMIILIVAFGALVAAGVPLLLAITAVVGTLGLVGPISQIVPMEESANSVILLIGLAVGVDYSMFYLRRKMEERDAGRSSEAALEFAAATSGKAVLISGLTVMIAMGGMFLAGNAVFTSFAVGTMLVVAVAMLGSVTVLPAILSKLGDNVERARVPFIGRLRHRNHGESRVWGWIIDKALARPVVSVVAAGGILVVLALPALNMKTVNPGVAGLPHDLPIMQTYERIQSEFPGGPLPALAVVQAKDVTSPAVTKGIDELKATAAGPTSVLTSPNKQVAIVSIPLPGNGTDETSDAALVKLRDQTIPATIGKVSGTETNVTGMTAGSKDFNDKMNSRLPIVFAFVLGLAFILLLVTFRSIVVPLKAIVLNLLSVAAAVPVRDPVRPEHGLSRVHHQPHPRGGRRRDDHGQGGRARHQGHGGRR